MKSLFKGMFKTFKIVAKKMVAVTGRCKVIKFRNHKMDDWLIEQIKNAPTISIAELEAMCSADDKKPIEPTVIYVYD